MPKLTKDKTRINITIDTYINDILNKKNINKSALICSLLSKFLILENNKTLGSKPQTPSSSKMTRPRFELGTTRLSVEHSNRAELAGQKNSNKH
jgi:hypothetical protein